jgi:hypothetical protein
MCIPFCFYGGFFCASLFPIESKWKIDIRYIFLKSVSAGFLRILIYFDTRFNEISGYCCQVFRKHTEVELRIKENGGEIPFWVKVIDAPAAYAQKAVDCISTLFQVTT